MAQWILNLLKADGVSQRPLQTRGCDPSQWLGSAGMCQVDYHDWMSLLPGQMEVLRCNSKATWGHSLKLQVRLEGHGVKGGEVTLAMIISEGMLFSSTPLSHI
jgi:hypothetical protein